MQESNEMRWSGLGAALLMLAGCYPYTPPALAPVTQPAPPATGQLGGDPQPTPAGAMATADRRTPVTILVSIDGFRPDYLDRGVTPNLNRLAAGGVSASMKPSFPSITFPNHWTIVTGLRPDRNGIVGNSFEDPRRPGETFSMQSDDPFWWGEAEPIWVAAEKAGIRTATMFWPGANVAWGSTVQGAHKVWQGGVRPRDWAQFNQAITNVQRVDTVLDWLRRPAAGRPRLVTLYFDTVDTAGHDFGPDDPRTTEVVAEVDQRIGQLVQGLAAIGQPANLVIVADHGMAATSSARSIPLDTLMNPADFRTTAVGALGSIHPQPGREAAVAAALLRRHDHMQCWRREAIPLRYHYGQNPRVAPIVCSAEVGWRIVPKAEPPRTGGDHGYDADAPEMRALFVASGPAFVAGKRLKPFDNVDVAPLLRDLIGLPPANGIDGDDKPFRNVLRRAR